MTDLMTAGKEHERLLAVLREMRSSITVTALTVLLVLALVALPAARI